MTTNLSRSEQEIQQLPLVELAWEILKAKKEPLYFRDLMNEIQALREMSEDAVSDVIARLYTEINIDGRFVCIGQNVWGLKRWYPVDKVSEKSVGKRFVRQTGDAFSDDDEDMDEEYDLSVADDTDDVDLFGDDEENVHEPEPEDGFIVDDEDVEFEGTDEEEAEGLEDETLLEDDGEEEDSEDENF